jgi:geranylgeranyl pyrophosphate synthase
MSQKRAAAMMMNSGPVSKAQSRDTRSASDASLAPSSFFARHGVQQLPSLSGAAVSQEHAILEPFRYTCSVSGKGMRSKIIDVFNNWLKVPDECRAQTAAIVEKLHNASLIIGLMRARQHAPCNVHRIYIAISSSPLADDIEDSSLQRRGRPVAHAVFGEAASINCANFIYFEAFHDAVCLGKPQVVPALLDELMKLHLGQV